MVKKYQTISILSLLLFLFTPFWVSAENRLFDVSLKYGMLNSAEVTKLQNFLIERGLLNVSATGNFLSLTLNAVTTFQREQGIETTGYFGPLTRAAANKIISVQGSAKPTISGASVSVENYSSGAAAVFLSGNKRIIKWHTNNYPTGAGININLIRKVSDNPKSFAFVKTVVVNTENDGEYIWFPLLGETGANMFIEIACPNTYQFTQGCQVSGEPIIVN